MNTEEPAQGDGAQGQGAERAGTEKLGTAAADAGADQGTGDPNRERPDVAPAQVSDDAIRENTARLEDDDEGAYGEE